MINNSCQTFKESKVKTSGPLKSNDDVEGESEQKENFEIDNVLKSE